MPINAGTDEGSQDPTQDRPATYVGTAQVPTGTTVPGTAPDQAQDRQDRPTVPGPGPVLVPVTLSGTGPVPTRVGQDGPDPVPARRSQDEDPEAWDPNEVDDEDQDDDPAKTRDQDAAIPGDPAWLTWAIGLGFAALSVCAALLASDGQVEAATRAQIPVGLRWFAPGVLELLGVLLMLLGYRRGRQGGSPWAYWLLAAGVGGYAINLTTRHAPTFEAALLYGGSSAALVLLSFLKFREDLLRYQRDVLKRRPKKPPVFGTLWLTRSRLALRAWLLAVEFDITEIALAKKAARTWCVIFDDTLDYLTGPNSAVELAQVHQADPDLNRSQRRDWAKKTRAAEDRARDLARRAADAAVAKALGQPFHIPRAVEVATIAMRTRPAPAVPATQDRPTPPRHGGADTWDEDRAQDLTEDRGQDRPRDRVALPEAPVSPVPAGTPTRVLGPSQDDPAGPRPAAVSCGLTSGELLAMVPADLLARSRAQSPAADFAADFALLDQVLPGWLTAREHPTKKAVQAAYTRCGNTRATALRQMIEAIRKAHADSTTSA